MITKITGKLLAIRDDTATIGIDAFEYEVLIPEFNRRQLQSRVGQVVSLHTLHFLDGNPSHGGRLTPRLVGFLRELEREFFEMICSVDGVGVRKALRAMVRPVQDVAISIEEQDAKALATLPGVGAATAERIIAKLRRRCPVALLVGLDEPTSVDVQPNVVEDTFQALCSLGHSESDARKSIDAVLAKKGRFKDVESLLRAIYDQSQGRD